MYFEWGVEEHLLALWETLVSADKKCTVLLVHSLPIQGCKTEESEEEKITPDTQLQGALGNVRSHMRFKQAEPKMCHPPKIENGVNN